MAEVDFYQPIKERLEKLFYERGKKSYLEITANKGLSEKLKQQIPPHREIVFSFLKKRPDIFGFVEGQHLNDLITVEVKEGIRKLDDLYQAKLYKEIFCARYGFLITTEPIPEEIKRLCKNNFDILRSVSDSIYRFLTIAQFDKKIDQFTDWFDEDPFKKDQYWQ